MSQLRSNYSDDNIRRIIASTDNTKSKIPKKLAMLCVAGLAAGLLSGHIGSFVKTNIIDKDVPVVTRAVVSQAAGKPDTAFDKDVRESIDKVHTAVVGANKTLDANPALIAVFQKEAKLSSLSPKQQELYHEVDSQLARSKVRLSNIRTDIDEKAAMTIVDGKSRFILADDLAERLENTESLYQTTVQRVMLQADHSLSL